MDCDKDIGVYWLVDFQLPGCATWNSATSIQNTIEDWHVSIVGSHKQIIK